MENGRMAIENAKWRINCRRYREQSKSI